MFWIGCNFLLAPTQTHTHCHLCLDTLLHHWEREKTTAFYKPTSLSANYRLNAKMFTIILWFSTLWGHVSVLSDKQLNCLLCSLCCSFAEFQIESLHLKRNSCESAWYCNFALIFQMCTEWKMIRALSLVKPFGCAQFVHLRHLHLINIRRIFGHMQAEWLGLFSLSLWIDSKRIKLLQKFIINELREFFCLRC